MRMPSPIFALVLIGQQHLCGCAQLGTVRPEELLLISPGISLGEARTRLGENNLHHHFTVERDGHVWRLFRCWGIFSRAVPGPAAERADRAEDGGRALARERPRGTPSAAQLPSEDPHGTGGRLPIGVPVLEGYKQKIGG